MKAFVCTGSADKKPEGIAKTSHMTEAMACGTAVSVQIGSITAASVISAEVFGDSSTVFPLVYQTT